jgi:nucleoside 2-deoxyribosyltransferase
MLKEPVKVSIKTYLAGPDVFLPNNEENIRVKLELCENAGLKPLYPLDNDVDPENEDAAEIILSANLEMINSAKIVLANTSPFRGPHTDPGTALEIGYAIALGKPVFGYTNDDRDLIDRIKQAFYKDIAAKDTLIENFGLSENLMISKSLIHPEFKVHEPSDLSAMAAFELLIKHIQSNYKKLYLSL